MRISDWSSDVCSSDLLWYRERDDKIISRSAEGPFAPHSGSDLAKKLANMMGKIEHEHDRIRGFIMVSPYISKIDETRWIGAWEGKEGASTCRSRCRPYH